MAFLHTKYYVASSSSLSDWGHIDMKSRDKIFLRAHHILTILLCKCYFNKPLYFHKVCYRTSFQGMKVSLAMLPPHKFAWPLCYWYWLWETGVWDVYVFFSAIPSFVKFIQLVWIIKLGWKRYVVGRTNTHTRVQTLRRCLEYIIFFLGRKVN